MEILLAALVSAAVAATVVLVALRRRPSMEVSPLTSHAEATAVPSATSEGASLPARRPAPSRVAPSRDDAEAELTARREEIARREERLRAQEDTLGSRERSVDQRERSAEDRARNLDVNAERLKEAKRVQVRELEDEIRHDSARMVRQVEDEARHDADRRARSILATCMQRVAGAQA